MKKLLIKVFNTLRCSPRLKNRHYIEKGYHIGWSIHVSRQRGRTEKWGGGKFLSTQTDKCMLIYKFSNPTNINHTFSVSQCCIHLNIYFEISVCLNIIDVSKLLCRCHSYGNLSLIYVYGYSIMKCVGREHILIPPLIK